MDICYRDLKGVSKEFDEDLTGWGKRGFQRIPQGVKGSFKAASQRDSMRFCRGLRGVSKGFHKDFVGV